MSLTAVRVTATQAQAELEGQRRALAQREAAALAAEQRSAEIAEQASRQDVRQRDLDAREGGLADKEVRWHTADLGDGRCSCGVGSQPSCLSAKQVYVYCSHDTLLTTCCIPYLMYPEPER